MAGLRMCNHVRVSVIVACVLWSSVLAPATEHGQEARQVWKLIAHLKDRKPDVQQKAADELVQIGGPAVLPLYTEVLTSSNDGSDSNLAADTIVRIGAPAVDDLIAMLTARDSESAQKLLIRIGAPAVGPLIEALSTPIPQYRDAAANTLREINDPRKVGAFIVALGNNDESLRAIAARALGESKAPRAVEALIETLEDRDPSVRADAAGALGSIKDPRAVVPLIQELEDTDINVRGHAVSALGEIKDPRAIEPLIVTMMDPKSGVQRDAAEALAGIKSPEVPLRLKKIAEDEHEPISIRGAAIRNLNDQAVLATLATKNDDPKIRQIAVESENDKAVLANVLANEKDENVREAADVTLAILQTANLSVPDRVKANWPKLRKGMPFHTVEMLVGPFSQEVREGAGWSALLGSLNSGPIDTSTSITTDLFTLKFENLALSEWEPR